MMFDPDDNTPIARIAALLATRGQVHAEGVRREPVTALQHALQCAQRAEWANAPDTLVVAAFLHDIGHLLADPVPTGQPADDRHADVGADLLAAEFGEAVAGPIRLHVHAKRFLVRVDPQYAASLTPASRHSLMLQGGPMNSEDLARFRRLAHAEEALQLRRWDDLAKDPDRATPPLSYYLPLLQQVRDGVRGEQIRDARSIYSS